MNTRQRRLPGNAEQLRVLSAGWALTHPDRAVAIWKELAENEIARVKPRAYQEAVPYLRQVRDVLTRSGREVEWGRVPGPP